MTHANSADDLHRSLEATARELLSARRSARALREFPGTVPGDLDAAYRCQDVAIAHWPDEIAGYKVGIVPPALRAQLGAVHLVGPIFRRDLRRVEADEEIVFPVFEGGFAAVEAEYVAVLGREVPASARDLAPSEASELLAELRIGIETAGSPLSAINDLGPTAVVSDFGNNHGLILGARIDDWRLRYPNRLTATTYVDEHPVGEGGAEDLPGGPLASLASALGIVLRRGLPLGPGTLISTGATTGIHRVVAGQRARAQFHDIAEIRCRAIAAEPRA